MWLDARIPLRLQPPAPLPAPDPDGVLLLMGLGEQELIVSEAGWSMVRRLSDIGNAAPDRRTGMMADGAHRLGCACCARRPELALRLSELFVQRARGELRLFRHVVLAMPAREIEAALKLLAAEPLVTARYRLADALG